MYIPTSSADKSDLGWCNDLLPDGPKAITCTNEFAVCYYIDVSPGLRDSIAQWWCLQRQQRKTICLNCYLREHLFTYTVWIKERIFRIRTELLLKDCCLGFAKCRFSLVLGYDFILYKVLLKKFKCFLSSRFNKVLNAHKFQHCILECKH